MVQIKTLEFRIRKMEIWIAEVIIGEAAQKVRELFHVAGDDKVVVFADHYGLDLSNFEENVY